MKPLRVLFLCTGNSARSQMAEALLRQISRGRIAVFSAGTEPRASIHPIAEAVLSEKFGIDTSGLHPKHVDQFRAEQFDYVFTVCDRAAETCPVFPGDPDRIHWGFADPAAVAPGPGQRIAFERVANELTARMRIWMALASVRARVEASANDQ